MTNLKGLSHNYQTYRKTCLRLLTYYNMRKAGRAPYFVTFWGTVFTRYQLPTEAFDLVNWYSRTGLFAISIRYSRAKALSNHNALQYCSLHEKSLHAVAAKTFVILLIAVFRGALCKYPSAPQSISLKYQSSKKRAWDVAMSCILLNIIHNRIWCQLRKSIKGISKHQLRE